MLEFVCLFACLFLFFVFVLVVLVCVLLFCFVLFVCVCVCFVSTVLGDKASEVKWPGWASAKLPESRPPPQWTGTAPVNEGVLLGELRGLPFLCLRSVHGWMGMDVWVNVFTMPILCADSGPWRKMSRAWPAVSAIATSSGTTWPNHQESAWGAAEAM